MIKIARFLLRMRKALLGEEKYRTKEKRYFAFAPCSKFLLTMGMDDQTVKKEIIDVLDLLDDESLKIEEFKIFPSEKFTITIPPSRISFHDFNELIQYLTDEVNTIGLVEGKELVYTVYDDPNTTNVIGQTDQGEKFFISDLDDTDKKQFLRINDDIELLEEYSVSSIRSALNAQKATISRT